MGQIAHSYNYSTNYGVFITMNCLIFFFSTHSQFLKIHIFEKTYLDVLIILILIGCYVKQTDLRWTMKKLFRFFCRRVYNNLPCGSKYFLELEDHYTFQKKSVSWNIFILKSANTKNDALSKLAGAYLRKKNKIYF